MWLLSHIRFTRKKKVDMVVKEGILAVELNNLIQPDYLLMNFIFKCQKTCHISSS